MTTTEQHTQHAIELVHLCSVRAQLSPISLENTPSGARIVFEVTGGELIGDRLRGTCVGPGADWLIIGPEGTGMLDVRFTLRTDDDALVYVQYHGRCDVREGPGSQPVYVAPRFETGDPRYAWLNLVQAVGKGTFNAEEPSIRYDWYEVR
jgi:hypothetical protein